MVWNRGPWHFDQCLIVLEEPSGPGEISKMKFNKVDFWIQLHNIPLMCMNKRVAKLLAEMIGDVVEIPVDTKDCWGKFMRVKVGIDVTKPLRRGMKVWISEFDVMITVLLRYERLPDFCYACGLVGHSFLECMNKMAKLEAMESSSPKFGGWLRATPAAKVTGRDQRRDFSN
ncbi:hypothetical protein ACOSQ3_018494 [Xanthoceras sorbifolium]